MKYTPDGYGERCRFDAFCKTVLRNEARTHLRDLGRQRNREIEFSALSQQEMDKLCTVDEYGNTPTQRAELDWLLYNKPLEYAQLVLGGEIEHYLSLGCDHGRLED